MPPSPLAPMPEVVLHPQAPIRASSRADAAIAIQRVARQGSAGLVGVGEHRTRQHRLRKGIKRTGHAVQAAVRLTASAQFRRVQEATVAATREEAPPTTPHRQSSGVDATGHAFAAEGDAGDGATDVVHEMDAAGFTHLRRVRAAVRATVASRRLEAIAGFELATAPPATPTVEQPDATPRSVGAGLERRCARTKRRLRPRPPPSASPPPPSPRLSPRTPPPPPPPPPPLVALATERHSQRRQRTRGSLAARLAARPPHPRAPPPPPDSPASAMLPRLVDWPSADSRPHIPAQSAAQPRLDGPASRRAAGRLDRQGPRAAQATGIPRGKQRRRVGSPSYARSLPSDCRGGGGALAATRCGRRLCRQRVGTALSCTSRSRRRLRRRCRWWRVRNCSFTGTTTRRRGGCAPCRMRAPSVWCPPRTSGSPILPSPHPPPTLPSARPTSPLPPAMSWWCDPRRGSSAARGGCARRWPLDRRVRATSRRGTSWGRIAALAATRCDAWRAQRRGGGETRMRPRRRRRVACPRWRRPGRRRQQDLGRRRQGEWHAVVESGGSADAPAPPAAAAPWARRPRLRSTHLRVRVASRLAPPWRTPLAMDGLSLSADGRTATNPRRRDSPTAPTALASPRASIGTRCERVVPAPRRASVWIGFADAGGADANHDGTVDRRVYRVRPRDGERGRGARAEGAGSADAVEGATIAVVVDLAARTFKWRVEDGGANRPPIEDDGGWVDGGRSSLHRCGCGCCAEGTWATLWC